MNDIVDTLIPNTMDEDKPLLEKEDENTEYIGIRTKVLLYVVIFGCAFQISEMAEPQYIYAYLI